ncbi:hypothetical protein SDC9_208178 [bioreactor metagenome]|uniref:Uncharacterized protein n=1 Tax=bioreactor metagenome TaxID=1076179 RepID=A0A645JBJ6_9ZZZZ
MEEELTSDSGPDMFRDYPKMADPPSGVIKEFYSIKAYYFPRLLILCKVGRIIFDKLVCDSQKIAEVSHHLYGVIPVLFRTPCNIGEKLRFFRLGRAYSNIIIQHLRILLLFDAGHHFSSCY